VSRSKRERLADRVDKIGTETTRALAKFATRKGANGELPCWGAIAEFVERNLDEDELEDLWRAMVEAGDTQAQLVLLSIVRDKPELVRRVARDEAVLSPVVRQALSALQTPTDSDSVRRFETRVNELLAVQYFVPDSVEPKRESQRRSK